MLPLFIAAPKLFGSCRPKVGEATRDGLPPYIEPGRAILEGEGVPGGGRGEARTGGAIDIDKAAF